MTIERHVRETGHFPSYRQIARRMSIGVSVAAWLVQSLIERGHLRRTDDSHQKLELVAPQPVRVEQTRYFRFNDELKVLEPWCPRSIRGGAEPGNRPTGNVDRARMED